MKLYKYAGYDETYYFVGCNDRRLYDYQYANYDGNNFYLVNIDVDDEENELTDLIMWAMDRLGEEITIEED